MDNEQAIDYEITLKFPSFSLVAEFLSDLENWTEYKKQKALKKEVDRRGKHTKEYHQKIREFQCANPLMSYRDCMTAIRYTR